MDSVPAGYRELDFDAFTRGAYIRALPVRFRIPADYVAVFDSNRTTRTYWASPADSARYAADPEQELQDGFYSVTVSLNVGYDHETNQFFSSGGNEAALRRSYDESGFTDVSFERTMASGYPVLFVEASKDGRRGMIAYVASLVDTNVLFVFYNHGPVLRGVDRERWEVLKRGILSPVPVPPPAP